MNSFLLSCSYASYSMKVENSTTLKATVIFLPLPRSSSMLPYFLQLHHDDLTAGNVQVVAMDFGIFHCAVSSVVVLSMLFH